MATDDAEFVRRLQRVDARRALEGAPYSAEVLDMVATARIPEVAQRLEARVATGDRDANVMLAHLNWLCEGNHPAFPLSDSVETAGGPPAALPEKSAQLPAELRRRIERSRTLEQQQRGDLSRACAAARFDPVAIDMRLRSAAEAGHEASLWELGRRSVDPDVRHKHWLSAAMLGYVPAQIGLAEILMAESLQGDRRNRGRMNFWLEAAAKQSPRALLLLGECRLNGCNAQPPDAESAVPLLRQAAVQGQAGALTALASISRGDPAALTDAELFGLHSFLHELNELGCFGAGAYGALALESARVTEEIGSRLSPHGLDDARALAAKLWREHGGQAQQAQGCG